MIPKIATRNWLTLLLFLSLITLFVVNMFRPEQVVRGKSSAIPLTDEMSPEQKTAQELALQDGRVQAYTNGQRSEVFGVRQILASDYPAGSAVCASADCRQVEIYNFDQNAAVTAIVNLNSNQVLEVLYQPEMQPGINKRLADRAMAIAINAPEVIAALGYRPTTATMAPVPGNLLNSNCDHRHLCAAPTFNTGERILWAVVDLTDDKLAGTNWTESEVDPAGNFVPFIPNGCPAPGTVNRDGWAMSYETTGTDSMRVYNVTYNGNPVITSVKLVEWHADYGSSGYTDATGCGGGGGGFPIYPYGETHIEDIYDGQTLIGFEVVQDFRMSSWGNTCNYRYEQRIQFYTDGRFRVASGAYGKGCGTNSLYRPIVRIDIAVNGDANDSFAYWDGTQWATTATETYRVPYTEAGHGPHYTNPQGYSWRVSDSGGTGYYIVQDTGQYASSEGDSPFLYPTLHNAAQGDTDLGIIGNCCLDNHQQGPHTYVNNENISNQNIVLWYVGQMTTDASSPDYYCWTLAGEPNPVTYPCITGPMFVPFAPAITPTASATNTATPTRTPTATNTPIPPTNTPTPITATATATPRLRTPTPTAVGPTATSTAPAGTLTSTPSLNDLIFADGFESGNLAAWSGNANDGGDLSVGGPAALVGSFGMQANLDDNNPIYVTDTSPNAESRYRARFYFDPNSIPMANNNSHFIFFGYSGASTPVLRLNLRFISGAYQLQIGSRSDGSSWVNSGWQTISDNAHFIELDWQAATAAGANNGSLKMWLDGTQVVTLSGLDNDTRRIDQVRLGAVSGVDNGTRGVYYFDAFESRRLNYIGP